ncbi:MAG: MFS transporter [Sulfolobaceae archaeon]|nr:MFS transporter [Sulfolobaceae archaeon]
MDSRNAMRTLVVLALMLTLTNYVETMVVPAIPKIQDQFGVTAAVTSWITSAYLIVGAITSPLFGKLGDRYGKKRVYLIAIIFYTIAVGLAGFSPNIYFLIGARAIQGFGYAVFPLAIAIITDIYPKERLAWAQGILSATLAIGPAIGLLVGSYIVEDLGWPYAFHTAFILSIAMLLVSAKYIVDIPSKTYESIDYTGALILMVAVSSFLVYLTEGPNVGWFTPGQVSLIILSLIFLGAFIPFERSRKEPLMKLSLFEIRNFFVANLAGLISGVAMFMMFFFVTYYAELPPPYGLGLSIIQTGTLMAPVALIMVIVGPTVGRIMSRSGPKPILVIGPLIGMLGFFLTIINRSTPLELLEDVLVITVGTVMIVVPLVNMVAVALPEDARGIGIGMNTLIRTIGSSIGPVAATSIMDSYESWSFLIYRNLIVPVAQLPSSTAFNDIAILAIGMFFLSFIVALFTQNYKFEVKAGQQAPI